MAAPIYTQNTHGRMVYLPEPMKMLRLRSVDDYDEEVLPAGHHYLRCALDEVLLFLRPGCIVPVAAPADNTAQLDDTQLTLWSYLPDGALPPTGCTPTTASPPTMTRRSTGAHPELSRPHRKRGLSARFYPIFACNLRFQGL